MRDSSEKMADSLARRASRRGLLGYAGGVGAGMLALTTRVPTAGAQPAPQAADAAVQAIWRSAAYRELRPQIIGPSGCDRYDPKADAPVARRPFEISPAVEAINMIPGSQRTLRVLSFDLLPGPQQKSPAVIVLPKVTFTLADGDPISVLQHTPTLDQGSKTVRGLGPSSGFLKPDVPFSDQLRQLVAEARRRNAERTGGRNQSPAAPPANTPTPSPIEQPYIATKAAAQYSCYCCFQYQCTSMGLDQGCYFQAGVLGCAGWCAMPGAGEQCQACVDNAVAFCSVCTAYECVSYYSCPCYG